MELVGLEGESFTQAEVSVTCEGEQLSLSICCLRHAATPNVVDTLVWMNGQPVFTATRCFNSEAELEEWVQSFLIVDTVATMAESVAR